MALLCEVCRVPTCEHAVPDGTCKLLPETTYCMTKCSRARVRQVRVRLGHECFTDGRHVLMCNHLEATSPPEKDSFMGLRNSLGGQDRRRCAHGKTTIEGNTPAPQVGVHPTQPLYSIGGVCLNPQATDDEICCSTSNFPQAKRPVGHVVDVSGRPVRTPPTMPSRSTSSSLMSAQCAQCNQYEAWSSDKAFTLLQRPR
jgi:hypothetical protein